MKKTIIKILTIFAIAFSFMVANSYALSLDTLNTSLDKSIVHPGEELKVHVSFGKQLGSYTFDFAYDKNLLEFVNTNGGEKNDNGTRVRVTFYDTLNPREDMDIIFKAKSGLTTSNPTEINITAEGLANSDATEQYDDIVVPITKQVTVEPVYENYKIALNYTGDIIKKEEKEMKLSVSSAMGKNYEHVRILAEATTPDGGNVKLLGTDSSKAEQDLIQSGWGADEGYAIGGKDVNQVLNLRGIFSKAGSYTIHFKLINRDDSDKTISEETVNVNVLETPAIVPPAEEPEETPTEPEKPVETPAETTKETVTEKEEEKMPTQLPKTGANLYAVSATVILILVVAYAYLARKEK